MIKVKEKKVRSIKTGRNNLNKFYFFLFYLFDNLNKEGKIVNNKIRVLKIVKKYGYVRFGGKKLNIDLIINLYNREHKLKCHRKEISQILLRLKLDREINFEKPVNSQFHLFWV